MVVFFNLSNRGTVNGYLIPINTSRGHSCLAFPAGSTARAGVVCEHPHRLSLRRDGSRWTSELGGGWQTWKDLGDDTIQPRRPRAQPPPRAFAETCTRVGGRVGSG